MERRLGVVHDLARKHRVPPRELPALVETLREQIARLVSSGQRAAGIERELASVEDTHRMLCSQLTGLRREAAGKLSQRVTAKMRELGMPGGSFAVDLRALESRRPFRRAARTGWSSW